MSRQSWLTGWISLAVGVATMLDHAPLRAQEVSVSAANCGSRVHVIARNAPLSEILRRMSNELSFELRFEGNSDPVLDIDVAQEPRNVVAKLAPWISIIIREAHDPRCLGGKRIAAVWVLPQGAESSPRGPVSPPPTPKRVPMTQEAQEALGR